MEQIKKTAEKVLKNCLGAKPGEVLLIVTDNTCGDIAGALYESGKDLGCEAVMMTMAELKVNGHRRGRGRLLVPSLRQRSRSS